MALQPIAPISIAPAARNNRISQPRQRRPCCFLLVFSLLVLSSQPKGAAARYFRNPTAGGNTGTGGRERGFGSVSLTLRQKQSEPEEEEEKEPAKGEDTTVVEEEEEEPPPDEEDEDESFFVDGQAAQQPGTGEVEDFFAQDETDFPTGMIPTESPAPTERPTTFPTTQAEAKAGEPTVSMAPTTETSDSGLDPAPPQTDFTTTDEGTFTVVPNLLEEEELPPTQMPTFMPTKNFSATEPPTFRPTETTLFSAPNNTDTVAEMQPLMTTAAPTVAPTFLIIAPVAALPVPNVTMTEGGSSSNASNTDDTLLDYQELDSIEPEELATPTTTPTNLPLTIAPSTEAPATNPPTRYVFPTPAPTDTVTVPPEPEFPLSGQLSLQLEGISAPFPGDTRLIFLATADEFIASSSVGHVEDIRVTVIYQAVVVPPQRRHRWRRRRWLQQPQQGVLQVDLGVEGLAYDELLSAKDWNMWLHNLFVQGSVDFVNMLQNLAQAEGSDFFEPLTAVTALEAATAIMAPTPPPSMEATPPLVAISNTGDGGGNGDGGDGEEGVPLIAIIGAAVGGFVFLIVGFLLIRYVMYLSRQKQASSAGGSRTSNSIAENFGASKTEDAADDGAAVKNNNSKWTSKTKSTTSSGIQSKPSNGAESSVSSSSYLTNNANHHNNFGSSNAFGTGGSNHPQYSSPPSDSDNQSQMGGTTTGDMSVMDNASYAYSLEPGIEPSLAGVPQSIVPSSGASAMSYTVYPGGSSVASMTSGTSSFAFMKMPIGNRNGGGIAGKPTKDVLAPAGKLGIVIDTTLDGPVVHKVNSGSALEGKLKSGDIIVAIDDVDTRAMTAASITALMVKTANQRRKLTVVSP